MKASFEEYTRLIWRVIHRHKFLHTCGSLQPEDLYQAGAIGLMKAIQRFEPQRGVTFSHYGCLWIRATIAREIANNAGDVKPPVHVQARRWRSGERVRERMAYLDAPVPGAEDGTLHDIIASPALAEPRLDAEGLLASPALTERERRLLGLRFFGGETLQDCADDMRLSRERVRQLEQAALGKLRAELR